MALAQVVELEILDPDRDVRKAPRIDLNEKLHESVAVRMGDTFLESLEVYARHVEALAGVRLSRANIIRQLLKAELEKRLDDLGLLEEDA